MDSSTPSDVVAPAPSGPAKRRLRNYLLDARFQMKFTLMVIGSTIVVAIVFGGFLWGTTKTLFSETEAAVEARSRAADTSRELSTATLNNELMRRFDDPAFVQQLKEQSQKIDEEYENERQAIIQQRSDLYQHQRHMLWTLIAGLTMMVLFIAAMCIIATHKIVGPLYRLKRISQDVAAGRLIEPSSHLREGDEFKDLFEEFSRMVHSLREHQNQELVTVETLIDRAERTGVSPEVLRLMKGLAEKMKARVETR